MTDHIMEKEANEFAMRLLVPTEFLLKDMEAGIDLTDDRAVERMAHRYRVPVAVMVLRIQQVSKEHKKRTRTIGAQSTDVATK